MTKSLRTKIIAPVMVGLLAVTGIAGCSSKGRPMEAVIISEPLYEPAPYNIDRTAQGAKYSATAIGLNSGNEIEIIEMEERAKEAHIRFNKGDTISAYQTNTFLFGIEDGYKIAEIDDILK